MYYLDFTGLYKRTTKEDRIKIRKTLNRNEVMELKLKQQHNGCFYCSSRIDMTGHLDHIIPIYRGGDNKLRNLAASCKRCNLTKGTDIIEITNPYTIKDYKRLIDANDKYMKKLKEKGLKYSRYVPKKVQLYRVYRADLFKEI